MTIAHEIESHTKYARYAYMDIVNKLTVTQSEASLTKNAILHQREFYVDLLDKLGAEESEAFLASDIDRPEETREAFVKLNMIKHARRRLRNDIANMDRVLQKLKQQVSANSSTAVKLGMMD